MAETERHHGARHVARGGADGGMDGGVDDPHPPGAGVLMVVAWRHLENRVLAALADAGYADITLAQGRLLARVADGGSRLTELAESGQVTKQTAGYLVDQLEGAGYVSRVPDPRDARARLVRLSASGLALRGTARGIEQEVEQEWADHLGRRRWRALRDALLALREITDPYL